MAKLTAVLVTLIGILLALKASGWVAALNDYYDWIFAVIVLVIGIGKLVRNFSR